MQDYIDAILYFSCIFLVVKSHHAMVKHLKLGQNYEDFEIKKLLVTILINLSVDSSVIPVSKQKMLNIF